MRAKFASWTHTPCCWQGAGLQAELGSRLGVRENSSPSAACIKRKQTVPQQLSHPLLQWHIQGQKDPVCTSLSSLCPVLNQHWDGSCFLWTSGSWRSCHSWPGAEAKYI